MLLLTVWIRIRRWMKVETLLKYWKILIDCKLHVYLLVLLSQFEEFAFEMNYFDLISLKKYHGFNDDKVDR